MKDIFRNVVFVLMIGCFSFEIIGMRRQSVPNKIENPSNEDGNVTINGLPLKEFLIQNKEAVIPVGEHIGNHYCKKGGRLFGGDNSPYRERVAVKNEEAAHIHQRALILWAIDASKTFSSVAGDEITVTVTSENDQLARPSDEGIYRDGRLLERKRVTGFKFKVGSGGTGFSHFEPLIQ